MRLNRLDLIRYGRFEDASIAFPRPSDGPDVTVVFGSNEAGKSTAFQGWLDVLFGFRGGPHPAAFRFDRSDLLVGAEVDLPGRGPLVVRRNGKRSGSLLDDAGRPLNEAILAGALHGLPRDAYAERFSLDDRGLRDGGARIAGAQGDLGQLLHAGLSGLTGMGQALDALSARADAFHRKGARKTVLRAGKDRLTEIGRAIRAGRLSPDQDRQLRRAARRAAEAFDAAEAALAEVVRRQAAARAAQTWHDRAAEIAALADRLAGLPDGPDLPPGTGEAVARLLAQIEAQEARHDEAGAEIARATQAIADLPEDPMAEPLAAALARLDGQAVDGASLLDRAGTAEADLGNRRAALAALEREGDRLLGVVGIGRAAAEELLRDPGTLEALAAAVGECTTAEQALATAEAALAAARGQSGDQPAAPRDLTALRAAHRHWQDGTDVAVPAAAVRQAEAALAAAVAGLPARWPDLVAAGLPARETLDQAARDAVALTADLSAARVPSSARAEELALATAALSQLAAAPEAVDAAAIEQTRRARDLAWQRHDDDLSPQTARRFADAMRADDAARAHYLTGAEARQRLRGAQADAAAATARHAAAQARHGDLAARQESAAGRCADHAAALGLGRDSDPAALAPRHAALMTAAAAAAAVATATAARDAAQAARDAARADLAAAAAAVDLADGADLPDRVLRALTLEEGGRAAWDKWQRDARTVTALADAARDGAARRDAALAALALRTASGPWPDPTPAAIGAALPQLGQLRVLRERAAQMAERIAGMEQAIAALALAAGDLAVIMALPQAEAAAQPRAVIDRARARVLAADRATERRQQAATARATAQEAQRRAATAIAGARDALAVRLTGQGAEDRPADERLRILQDRDALRARVAAAEADRAAARAGADAALFAEELAILPDATRVATLARALDDAQGARDMARDAAREAARVHAAALAAVQTDALATEQATLLADLREGARQAAVARLGVLAARGALRRLAAERRSDMLRDVEEAFVAMTAPAWTGVDVWTQGEGERLVGRQADGTAVPVEAMSTGTMGQLYFALRVAGYRSFAADPGPLPMILDDIMETFDDTRARAALQLCARIGGTGQAILFTHHAHLVDLARAAIPGVGVVTMPT